MLPTWLEEPGDSLCPHPALIHAASKDLMPSLKTEYDTDYVVPSLLKCSGAMRNQAFQKCLINVAMVEDHFSLRMMDAVGVDAPVKLAKAYVLASAET